MSTKTTKALVPHLHYMSAWFCPFAHRATLALEHHAGHVTYDWVESLGWEKRRATAALDTEHENWYHFKAPELMKHNPLGMVPTLVPPETFHATSGDPTKNVVTESLVCVQFIDELVAGGTTPIMSSCPYERARARVDADWVNKNICSKYYTVLVRQEAAEQREGFEELVSGLERFATWCEEGPGAFYAGRDTPGLVDYALFPWAWRLPVFEKYRGMDYAIPRTPALASYHAWLEAMLARDEVRRTLPPWEDYLEHIGRYADGSARSKVGNAVRLGRAAHDYNDTSDNTDK
jgi:glutathione S-transferase